MKLITKNGMKFAVGMFWQIPDYGKKNINLSKLVKDTGHNMYCQIKSISLTYGFCNKDALQGEKKVASLGKYIIETSKLNAEYANSIICYKFKSAGELDDMGKPLKEDLYGYIVLLNGTICPTDGEYVAEFDLVKNSIIEQAKQHFIDTLYLPTDVSLRMFNLYERLDNAFYDDEALVSVLNSASIEQLKTFKEFIELRLGTDVPRSFIHFLGEHLSGGDLRLPIAATANNFDELRQIMRHEAFRLKIRDNIQMENNIRYLIANIIQVPFSSDAIYWTNTKFKHNYNRSLLQSVSSQTSKKYKAGALAGIFGIFAYFTYNLTTDNKVLAVQPSKPKPIILKPVALMPGQLIELCLAKNDRFFKDMNHWVLTGLKCNSLGSSFMFSSNIDTTLSTFSELIGESSGVSLQQKRGIYTKKFGQIKRISIPNTLSKQQIINNLQQAAIDYSFTLTLPNNLAVDATSPAKYVINSKTSPVFLFNHGVLNGVKLMDINMNFDTNSGIYNWTMQGEF